jgi:predicted amidohydrolase YtcJ
MIICASAGPARLDDTTGRIARECYGDLAVLERDLFAGPAAETWEATVIATYLVGECVFRPLSAAVHRGGWPVRRGAR